MTSRTADPVATARGAVRPGQAPVGGAGPPRPAGAATGLVERVQRRLA